MNLNSSVNFKDNVIIGMKRYRL